MTYRQYIALKVIGHVLAVAAFITVIVINLPGSDDYSDYCDQDTELGV